MKEKVSAMMDGELKAHEVEELILTLNTEDYLKSDWQDYHLIGDAIRQSNHLSVDLSQRISQQLAAETTILAPSLQPSFKHSKQKVFSYAIAASIVAMVTAWFGLQYDHQQPQALLADYRNAENAPASHIAVSTPSNLRYHYSQYPEEINDYLLVHREFLPSTMTYRQPRNIHTVAESHHRVRYGRNQDTYRP